jgi:DNA-binding MarR family transcriptional regulator
VNDRAQIETPLWLALLHAASRVETRFEAALAESGLSISKLGVLRTLVEAGEPMPLSRLAGKLSCVKSNVTQLVDRLEADGLVVRVNDPADRRSILASVTAEGRARFEAGRTAVGSVEQELFGAFETVDRERLSRLLASVAKGGCGS